MIDPGPSLSTERLQAILKTEGYPSSTFGIGRRGQYLDQAFVIDKWSNRWVVYYTECGSKTDIRKHTTEDAACSRGSEAPRRTCESVRHLIERRRAAQRAA